MTANELRQYFNNAFGMERPWPKSWEVDAETYGYCCQEVFDWNVNKHLYILIPGEGYELTRVVIGLNNGLIFKGVELILKK